MIQKLRIWYKQKFCKHRYGWYIKIGMFGNIQGESRVKMCSKCGKIVDEYFAEYEGSGYR